jgi:hypothetical protein
MQTQETLNATEEHQAIGEPQSRWQGRQPKAMAMALAYRSTLQYITNVQYFHSGCTENQS